MTPEQRERLRRFLMHNPHPPWMHDERYFKRNGFGDDDDVDVTELLQQRVATIVRETDGD